MTEPDRALVQRLVAEEIRRLVADTIESPRCLAAQRLAERLQAAYPNCGMTADEIAAEIVTAAIGARVPVEIGRSSQSKR